MNVFFVMTSNDTCITTANAAQGMQLIHVSISCDAEAHICVRVLVVSASRYV